LLELFLLQKTLYEISYEAANRPSWITVPVRGLLDLLGRAEAKAV
jgi:maltose alpha-D-glucosyltransferase/alpha-amylase